MSYIGPMDDDNIRRLRTLVSGLSPFVTSPGSISILVETLIGEWEERGKRVAELEAQREADDTFVQWHRDQIAQQARKIKTLEEELRSSRSLCAVVQEERLAVSRKDWKRTQRIAELEVDVASGLESIRAKSRFIDKLESDVNTLLRERDGILKDNAALNTAYQGTLKEIEALQAEIIRLTDTVDAQAAALADKPVLMTAPPPNVTINIEVKDANNLAAELERLSRFWRYGDFR